MHFSQLRLSSACLISAARVASLKPNPVTLLRLLESWATRSLPMGEDDIGPTKLSKAQLFQTRLQLPMLRISDVLSFPNRDFSDAITTPFSIAVILFTSRGLRSQLPALGDEMCDRPECGRGLAGRSLAQPRCPRGGNRR